MERLCDRFDQYRDGSLGPEQHRQFESHMVGCQECRTRFILLNNLVSAVRNTDLPDLAILTEQVADNAFERCASWDVLFLSWLKPAPAWSALAVLAFLLSFLWAAPFAIQTGSSDYEAPLLIEVEQVSQDVNTETSLTDDQLELWLEQGGAAK